MRREGDIQGLEEDVPPQGLVTDVSNRKRDPMKKLNQKAFLALVAMGIAGTVANAQFFTDGSGNNYNNPPFLITITGATLQQTLFTSQASTNDYIDLDRDGISGSTTANNERLNNLQPVGTAGGTNAGTQNFLNTYYRAVGSVNGVVELASYGSSFRRTPATLTLTGVNPGFYNRQQIITNGVIQAVGNANAANPGGSGGLFDDGPGVNFGSRITATYVVGPNTYGGIRADIAPSDVPPDWIARAGVTADAAPLNTPYDSGFGLNPRLAVDLNGNNTTRDNLLPDFSALGRTLYSPSVTPDANTIFSTYTAFAPIGPLSNFGIGRTTMTMTDLRHGFATGRLKTGENLMFMTRDIGSGTRNGFANAIGLDPAFSVGENVGASNSSTTTNTVGAGYLPTNKNSSGGLRDAVINTRLGIGQFGVELAVNQGVVTTTTGANADFLGIKNDVEFFFDNGSTVVSLGEGTTFVRPHISELVQPAGTSNIPESWVIGGRATLATLGDPANRNEFGGTPGNNNPRMPNPAAAAYINNIVKSLAAVSAVPTDPANDGSAGQFIAQDLVAPTAVRYFQGLSAPHTYTNNAQFSVTTYDWTIGVDGTTFLPNHRLNTNALLNANTISNGRVPQRQAGTYSDSSLGFAPNYRTEDNVTLVQGTDRVPARSKISGDFNNDGARNAGDITVLVNAYRKRNLGFVYSLPSPAGACLEILGDFNSDGSFNLLDVRYFADGLALYSGVLDRKQGFTAVDNAFPGNNIFGLPATYSTGVSQKPGDARADVTGASGKNPARGFAPIASDNVIDAKDITYISAQWHTGTVDVAGGVGRTVVSVDWSDINAAVNADLSADVTGDLVINYEDTLEVVHCILGTTMTDFDLDGTNYLNGDAEDIAAFAANENLAGGFAQGDANGDGLVNSFDLCVSDVNLDGVVDFGDFLQFFNYYDVGNCRGDITGSGDGSDFGNFLAFFNGYDAGC
jgi:hypothetical protein